MVTSYQGKLQEPKRERYPNAKAFMSKSFVTVSPDTDIYQAMKVLLKYRVSGAPVMDSNGEMVGIVTEKDCLYLAAHDTYENDRHGGPVSNFMTTEVLTLTPETGLSEVAQIFMDTPYRKLPVLDNGKLVGVVRRSDVLEVIQVFHKKRAQYMKQVGA